MQSILKKIEKTQKSIEITRLNINKEFLEEEGKSLMEEYLKTDFSLYNDHSIYFNFIKILLSNAQKFDDFPQKIETIKQLMKKPLIIKDYLSDPKIDLETFSTETEFW